MTLNVGDKAPDFSLKSDTGVEVSTRNLIGKQYVLYFYPKDYTPGCTKEACDFRDNFDKFKKQGIEIYGISKDSENTHTNFKKKYDLPFTLLVDNNADVCEAYGVVNKKSMFGLGGNIPWRASLNVSHQ